MSKPNFDAKQLVAGLGETERAELLAALVQRNWDNWPALKPKIVPVEGSDGKLIAYVTSATPHVSEPETAQFLAEGLACITDPSSRRVAFGDFVNKLLVSADFSAHTTPEPSKATS